MGHHSFRSRRTAGGSTRPPRRCHSHRAASTGCWTHRRDRGRRRGADLRPQIVRIVNITEDSFSDGGLHLAPEDALAHARRLRSEGADIIELGPASSHPDTARVTVEEERRRLAPVMDQLISAGIPVSVDSFLPNTQRFALSRGATYLSDIQGFPDRDLYESLAAADCRLIVMHSVQATGPATKVTTDPGAICASIDRFLTERLGALVRRLAGRGPHPHPRRQRSP
jgi:dihydropteroate synthase type 2